MEREIILTTRWLLTNTNMVIAEIEPVSKQISFDHAWLIRQLREVSSDSEERAK